MKKVGNIIEFETDAELTDYCLYTDPVVFPREINGKTFYGYDYDFTDDYNNDVDNGITFTVKDPKSRAMKTGHISRGLITKKLNNLSV